MKATFRWLLAAAIAAALIGCITLPQGGAGYVRSSALPAPPDPVDNPTTPEKAALGKQLFLRSASFGRRQHGLPGLSLPLISAGLTRWRCRARSAVA
jgi:hypothetical protein